MCSSQLDPKVELVKYTKQEGFIITDRCKDITKLTEVVRPVKMLTEVKHRSTKNSTAVTSSVQSEVSPAETVRTPFVSHSEEDISKRTELTVYFDFNSYELSEDAKRSLEKFLSTVSESKVKSLYVTGFTCKIGVQKYNDVLAFKRALSVKTYLESLSPELKDVLKLRWKGRCCYKDLVDLSKNRRVEITYSDPVVKYKTEFYHKE